MGMTTETPANVGTLLVIDENGHAFTLTPRDDGKWSAALSPTMLVTLDDGQLGAVLRTSIAAAGAR